MQIVKGMVAYGAAAMAEIDLITQRLKARAGEADLDTAWKEEWSREADRVAEDRRRGRCRGPQDHRRQPVHARRQLLLQRRALHPAGRGEARDVSQGAALLPGRDGAAASRHRARRGALREHQPAGLFRQGPRPRQAADRGAVRRHGQRQGDERDLRRPRLRQARHQHAGDRRAGPVRAAAAAQHPQPPRLRGRRHPGLRLCRRAPRGRSQARRGDGLQLRRLSCAAHLRVRQALRRLRRVRRHALERLRLRRRPQSDRSARSFGLDLPVPLGGRRPRQRDRAGMGEEIHARRRGRRRSNARS